MAERFLAPVDVLYLHGTGQFGTPSRAGDVLMPPWPSVAAGALRSRMLVDAGVDVEAFAAGRQALPSGLDGVLGTPRQPGTFEVRRFQLARREAEGIVPLYPLPQDLVVRQEERGVQEKGGRQLYPLPQDLVVRQDPEQVHRLEPRPLPEGIAVGTGCTPERLPMAPLLRAAERFKPATGFFLDASGWARYRRGEVPGPEHLVPNGELWKGDPRLGIAMDGETRTAREGMIYTTSALCLQEGVGFLVEVAGADGCLPREGLLRFGGEGRAVEVEEVARQEEDEPPWERLTGDRRFQVVLLSWGLLPGGWRLPGMEEVAGQWWWGFGSGRARLAAACVPRPVVVAGWDLAAWAPKPALRAAPPGAVYWFDRLEGSQEALRSLEAQGLWPLLEGCESISDSRRAEGFNHFAVAAWPHGAGGGHDVPG